MDPFDPYNSPAWRTLEYRPGIDPPPSFHRGPYRPGIDPPPRILRAPYAPPSAKRTTGTGALLLTGAIVAGLVYAITRK